MTPRTKPSNCPSPRKRGLAARLQASGERGVAFLIMIMVLTVLLISLTVALPDVFTQGQREREEELIFRGNEYARAIMLYHRQFNKFPTSVEDLIKKTNGYRFLRHAYPDPMTRSGKWRFIHANAAGVVIDSKTLTPPPAKNPAQGGSGSDNQDTAQVAPPAGDTAQSPSPTISPESGETPRTPSAPSSTFGPSSFSLSSSDNPVQGAFIVGVASLSTRRSIRVLNNHTRYDEWEFLGIATQEGPGTVQPGAPSPGGPGTGGAPQTPGGGMGPGAPPNPQNPQ